MSTKEKKKKTRMKVNEFKRMNEKRNVLDDEFESR